MKRKNEQIEPEIPTASFSMKTDMIDIDGFFPETQKPTYDLSFTMISRRIWWKPWTWFWRKKTTRTMENCTIDVEGKMVTVKNSPMQKYLLKVKGKTQ